MNGGSVAVVQARLSSTRLPRKSLLPVAGIPLVELVLRRVTRARTLDRTILAIPDATADAALAPFAELVGAALVRESESDVLRRFEAAVRRFPCAWVVRVCADNPFVAPEVVDAAVELARDTDADYVDAITPATGLPDGVGAEVVRAAALLEAATNATHPGEREHVTRYFFSRPDRFKLVTFRAPAAWQGPDLQLDIDYPEDLAAMDALARALPEPPESARVEAIIGTARRHPELLARRRPR